LKGKACCEFSDGGEKFVEEVDCDSNAPFACCMRRANGVFKSWLVERAAAGPCQREEDPTGGVNPTIASVGIALAIPKPDPIPIDELFGVAIVTTVAVWAACHRDTLVFREERAVVIPGTRRCTEAAAASLQAKVNRTCKIDRRCKGDQDCATLQQNLQKNIDCANARDIINGRCFGGGDPGHVTGAAEAWGAVARCGRLLTKKGC
jgi:hypothetical protein